MMAGRYRTPSQEDWMTPSINAARDRHYVIRLRPDAPRLTNTVLGHVDVEFDHQGIARAKGVHTPDSHKLPLECREAAEAYPAAFVVEERSGEALRIMPKGIAPTNYAGGIGPGNIPRVPGFAELTAVGMTAEDAHSTYNFHRLLQQHGVYPYGNKPPEFMVLFGEQLDAIRAAIEAEVREELARGRKAEPKSKAPEGRHEMDAGQPSEGQPSEGQPPEGQPPEGGEGLNDLSPFERAVLKVEIMLQKRDNGALLRAERDRLGITSSGNRKTEIAQAIIAHQFPEEFSEDRGKTAREKIATKAADMGEG
jgi:hypothetical protein